MRHRLFLTVAAGVTLAVSGVNAQEKTFTIQKGQYPWHAYQASAGKDLSWQSYFKALCASNPQVDCPDGWNHLKAGTVVVLPKGKTTVVEQVKAPSSALVAINGILVDSVKKLEAEMSRLSNQAADFTKTIKSDNAKIKRLEARGPNGGGRQMTATAWTLLLALILAIVALVFLFLKLAQLDAATKPGPKALVTENDLKMLQEFAVRAGHKYLLPQGLGRQNLRGDEIIFPLASPIDGDLAVELHKIGAVKVKNLKGVLFNASPEVLDYYGLIVRTVNPSCRQPPTNVGNGTVQPTGAPVAPGAPSSP